MTHLRLLVLLASILLLASPAGAQPEQRPELDQIDLGQGWLGVALQAVDGDGNPIDEGLALPPPGSGEGTGAARPVEPTEPERSYVGVTQIFPGTPAATAELQPGDLILRIDDHDLVDVQDLIARVQSSRPGTTVELTLRRGDEVMRQPIMLGTRPEVDDLLVSIFVDSPAPALTANNLTDDSQLSLPEASVVVLDFWATWCGPCRRALPELNELQARFASQGVRVIGISNEDPATIREFTAETAIDYTVAYDLGEATTRDYFITAYPTVFVIDSTGTIRDVFIGGGELHELGARIEELTGGRSAQ